MAFTPLLFSQMPDPIAGLSFNDGLLKLLDAATAGDPLPGTTHLDCASIANEPGAQLPPRPVRVRIDSVLRVCTTTSCPGAPPPPTINPVGSPPTAKLAVPSQVTFSAPNTATVGGVDIFATSSTTPLTIDDVITMLGAWMPQMPQNPPVLMQVYVVTDPRHVHPLDGFTIAIPTYPAPSLPPPGP